MSLALTQMLGGEKLATPYLLRSIFHYFVCHNLIKALIGRFFKHYLVLLCLSQMASGLFRLTGGLGRNKIVANTCGAFALLAVIVMGGFILTRGEPNIKIQ